jgi:hypothetical protein
MVARMNTRLVPKSSRTNVDAFSLTLRRSDGRCFPIITSVSAMSYHAIVVALCSYLPQESMAIGYGVAGYATVACLISFLGLYGTIVVCIRYIRSSKIPTDQLYQQNRTLICLFSHSLLLDALISTCARILLLELFFSIARSQDTCSSIIEAVWTDQRQPSHDVMSSLEWQHAVLKAGVWCRLSLDAVHVACIGVLICTCAAQGTVAVAVRKYGMQVGCPQEVDSTVDEKGGREEACDVKVEMTQET